MCGWALWQVDTGEATRSFWVAGEGLREEEKMRQTGFVANQEPQLPLPGQSGLRRQPRDSGSRHRSSLGLPPPPQAPGRVGQAAGYRGPITGETEQHEPDGCQGPGSLHLTHLPGDLSLLCGCH